jgi:hypothetical protein
MQEPPAGHAGVLTSKVAMAPAAAGQSEKEIELAAGAFRCAESHLGLGAHRDTSASQIFASGGGYRRAAMSSSGRRRG